VARKLEAAAHRASQCHLTWHAIGRVAGSAGDAHAAACGSLHMQHQSISLSGNHQLIVGAMVPVP